MAYTKFVYTEVGWKNGSESLTTPLGKTNLRHMDSAIYNIAENLDIVHSEMSSGKFDKDDAGKVIVGMPTWNPNTGILAFQFYDGTMFQVDFNVEKIPVSFSMDSAGRITMTTSDGTEWTADIGDVIPDYTFVDSDTIAMSDVKNGTHAHTISAQIKKGSVKGEYLQPDYLADVTTQANSAKASAKTAGDYADAAEYDAKLSQSYAVGGSGIREGEATDSAKFYKEKAEEAAEEAGEYLADLQSVQVTGVKGSAESDYRKGNVNLTASNVGAAPTSHASTETTYGVSSATNYGHAMASSTTPKINGNASVGTETNKFARGDHVHPLQTSVSGSSGSCTGNAATATKLATARTMRTNLASASTASFNGTADITPGVTGTLPVANGGTGKTSFTSGQVLVGNGTSAVSQRAIDSTSGGTSGSGALITSGAVFAGLNAKVGKNDFLFFSQQKSYTGSGGTSTVTITINDDYEAIFLEAHMLNGTVNGSKDWDCYVKSFSQSGTTVNITLSGAYMGAISISGLCEKI